MLVNTDCTVYRYADGGYERVYIPAVFWRDSHGVRVASGGLITVDEVLLYIPEEHAELAPRTPQKDILVRGSCPHTFDNTSATSVSASLRELNARYTAVTVTSVSDKRYGAALRHIKVVAK